MISETRLIDSATAAQQIWGGALTKAINTDEKSEIKERVREMSASKMAYNNCKFKLNYNICPQMIKCGWFNLRRLVQRNLNRGGSLATGPMVDCRGSLCCSDFQLFPTQRLPLFSALT